MGYGKRGNPNKASFLRMELDAVEGVFLVLNCGCVHSSIEVCCCGNKVKSVFEFLVLVVSFSKDAVLVVFKSDFLSFEKVEGSVVEVRVKRKVFGIEIPMHCRRKVARIEVSA